MLAYNTPCRTRKSMQDTYQLVQLSGDGASGMVWGGERWQGKHIHQVLHMKHKHTNRTVTIVRGG